MKLSKWKFPVRCALAFAVTLLTVTCGLRAQTVQHFHVNAGALGTSAGSALYFTDASGFLADSGYVANMPLRTNPPTVGYYMGGPTFASASSSGLDGPPAAPGARLAIVVSAVAGPDGGNWSFWETSGNEEYGDSITFTVPAGTTNGTNRFIISENTGLPGEDPYGHIHGRAFTADKPGLYSVWVQIIDVSRNGPGGGPIHVPSPLYQFYFNAGFNISRLSRTNNVMNATFGSRTGSRFYLEASPALGDPLAWATVAGPLSGNNHLRTLSDSITATEPFRYYRLRVTTP